MSLSPNQNPSSLAGSSDLVRRQAAAKAGQFGLMLSLVFALLALIVLVGTIVDQVGGYTVTIYSRDPREVADRPIAELSASQLVGVLQANLRDAAFDALVVEGMDAMSPAARTALLEKTLGRPDERTLSDVPLDELSALELVQGVIAPRLGGDRVRALADEQLAQSSDDDLREFIRDEFLVPVSETDLTGGAQLEDLDFEALLTIINERFTDALREKYDVSELANESNDVIIDVIRKELVGVPDENAILGKPLAEASHEELRTYLAGRFSEEAYAHLLSYFVAETAPIDELRGIVRGELLQPLDPRAFSPDKPLQEMTPRDLSLAARTRLPQDRQAGFHASVLSTLGTERLSRVIDDEILVPAVAHSWGLFRSIFDAAGVRREAAAQYPGAPLEFRGWITREFFTNVMSTRAEIAGIRTALLGTLWLLALTIVFALPIGVGAAIYLEELAGKSGFSRLVQINIYNLAGIPSIIYGMLGLTIFVRTLGDILGVTNGAVFGLNEPSGRTILSAALTMALLVLPLIIVNSQEAIRAVPNALREAAYGIGLTKLQTIWHHVLPSALPGILTGAILAMSRAIGETAPLIVIGASTFIVVDPSGPFSKFTVLPIQIYKWTSLPDETFRNVASAAIVVLMTVLVTLNLAAILLRNRFRRQN